MEVIKIAIILFPIVMIAAGIFICGLILIKNEEGTISPVKLYRIYRKQICAMLKMKNP